MVRCDRTRSGPPRIDITSCPLLSLKPIMPCIIHNWPTEHGGGSANRDYATDRSIHTAGSSPPWRGTHPKPSLILFHSALIVGHGGRRHEIIWLGHGRADRWRLSLVIGAIPLVDSDGLLFQTWVILDQGHAGWSVGPGRGQGSAGLPVNNAPWLSDKSRSVSPNRQSNLHVLIQRVATFFSWGTQESQSNPS